MIPGNLPVVRQLWLPAEAKSNGMAILSWMSGFVTDQSLYSAFGQSEVSVIYKELNQYYVVLEVAPKYWQDPSGLNNIYLTSGGSSPAQGNSARATKLIFQYICRNQYHRV
jgi:hypothetical protein